MTPEFYRVIHVTCALLLYLSLGAVVFENPIDGSLDQRVSFHLNGGHLLG